jgi:hypothetical protein
MIMNNLELQEDGSEVDAPVELDEPEGPLFGDGIDFGDDGLDFDNVNLSAKDEASPDDAAALEESQARTSTDDIVFDGGDGVATVDASPALAPEAVPAPVEGLDEAFAAHESPPTEAAPRRPALPKKPMNMTVILGIVAGVMVIGAIILVVVSSPKKVEIPADELPPEPTYRTPAIEVVRVRTSPPALRILVDGQSKGSSPLELKIRENEFPVTITARFNASTELERILTGPEDEIFFDFSHLIK